MNGGDGSVVTSGSDVDDNSSSLSSSVADPPSAEYASVVVASILSLTQQGCPRVTEVGVVEVGVHGAGAARAGAAGAADLNWKLYISNNQCGID